MDKEDLAILQQLAEGNRQNAQFNRFLVENSDILSDVEAALRNARLEWRLNDKKEPIGYWVQLEGTKAKVNETGLREILHFVSMHLNKNIWMSNIDREEVYKHVRSASLDFNDMVAANATRWELDTNFYDELIETITYNIWFSFNRPKDEGERVYQSKTYNEILTTTKNISDKKEGIQLPSILGFGRKKDDNEK